MLRRAVCLFFVGLLAAQSAPDPGAIAKQALDMMLGGKYQEMNQMFTPEGQKAFPADALRKIGAQNKTWGAPSNIGAPVVNRPGPNFVVVIPVSFATQNINFTFAVNPAGQVVAFLERPGEVAWQRPPYSKPESFRERAVTLGDDWKLAGALTVPAGNGPFPAVVLVHDSGPQDRDESVFGSKPFRDLAEGLASRGMVVLRYEKRTRAYVARMADKANRTARDETGDDALKALALLRTEPEVNPQKVFLLGHGLGGYLAPRIAQADGKLAGVIILGGNARPLEDVLVDLEIYQGTLAGKDLDLLKLQAKRVKTLDAGDADSPPILGMPAAYILDLKGYDPVAEAKGLAARLLIVQGERDFQVTAKDFDLWKSGLAGRKDATLRSFPSLNHLMVAGQGKGTEAEYRKPGHVAPEVVDEIAKWIGQ